MLGLDDTLTFDDDTSAAAADGEVEAIFFSFLALDVLDGFVI
jgi:hypothetical protein